MRATNSRIADAVICCGWIRVLAVLGNADRKRRALVSGEIVDIRLADVVGVNVRFVRFGIRTGRDDGAPEQEIFARRTARCHYHRAARGRLFDPQHVAGSAAMSLRCAGELDATPFRVCVENQ